MANKKVLVAAGLLEIESLLMNTRSQALQGNRGRFIDALIESRAKLGALVSALLANQGAALDEVFPAVDEPPADDAVDPSAADSGKPTTRDSNSVGD